MMGIKREEMLELINPEDRSPSLTYWASLLTFFENNKPTLDVRDMTILCAETERVRAYCNDERRETITIFRNGAKMDIERSVPGKGISKDDTHPRIYDHLDQLLFDEEERERVAQELREEKKASVESPGEKNLPMVAAPG